MSNSAQEFADTIITGLQNGEISRLPNGDLRGDSLNMGLVTTQVEIEESILRRNPGAADEVQRFRAYLAGKDTTTTAPATPEPPKEPEREPTTAERTLQSLRRSLEELNVKLAGR